MDDASGPGESGAGGRLAIAFLARGRYHRRMSILLRPTACAVTLVALVVACAQPAATSPAAVTDAARGDNGTALSGIVLDGRGGLPVSGVHVFVGSRHTTTDGEGRFTIDSALRTYDLVLVNEESSLAHVYTQVSRRDLALTFGKRRDAAKRSHHAQISGRLTGGGDYPLPDALHVNFRGAFTTADEMLGGMNAPDKPGPDFGPLNIDWDGPATLDGELFSARRSRELNQGYCARTPVRLTDGGHQRVTHEFKQVPLLERAAIRLSSPVGELLQPTLIDEYHVPGSGRVLHGNEVSDVHPYAVADLRACGLTLCTLGWMMNPYLRASAITCGPASAEPASMTLREPPKLSNPAPKSRAEVGATFTWSSLPDAVYSLSLEVYSMARPRQAPASTTPTIVVFSSKPTATWPDLTAMGPTFPESFAVYMASVTAHGPYADLDRALGPEGLSFGTPSVAWNTESQPTPLFVEELEASQCQYPKPRPLVCNEAGATAEVFRLTEMNDKLRHYPAFAKAIGLHCVADCATARAFTRGYEEYLATHPEFDADNDLLEPDVDPEPPLPPPSPDAP